MNTKHAIAAISATLFAASAFAAEAPAGQSAKPVQQEKPLLLASAATTATAAAATATIAVTAKPVSRSRAEVHAEAVEAVRTHRSTMDQHYDLLK